MNYGTFYSFSWDIIEPMTNLLAILDVIIAYVYFLYTNNQYSLGDMFTYNKNKRFNKLAKKHFVDNE